ncbi:glycosyltransferase family 2 protein [Bacillus gobiensis]|uniref:glycosyltransferase family 2 protein n=1 Tax=Bacillus gobiensis TaxID=1441095 RepID=UPI003D1ECD54
MKIAAVLTCFNRKSKTLNCIKKLNQQYQNIDIYVCDDASTDFTSEAIEKEYPKVRIIKSNGGLFWSKGMYQGMKSAILEDYDFYLMVNDDVDFYDNMLKTMINSYMLANHSCGIVGSTKSANSDKLTYGGSILQEKWNINKKTLLNPNRNIQQCDFANWNCFLIDRSTIETVGLIDNKYEHGTGDFDYSCRMNKKGIPIYVATDYIGTCDRNTLVNTFSDNNLSRRKRISLLVSKKGLPIKSSFRFYWKNYKLIGIPFWVWMYLRVLMLISLGKNC